MQEHVKGVLTDNHEVVNIHEPRRRVNSKPDLNVYQPRSANTTRWEELPTEGL